jgi:hypothetical protein
MIGKGSKPMARQSMLDGSRIWLPLFRIGRVSVGLALKPRLRLTFGVRL